MPKRRDVFKFRCTDDDRRIIAALAVRLQRTQSDAVRWIVREAACELSSESAGAGMPAADRAQENWGPHAQTA